MSSKTHTVMEAELNGKTIWNEAGKAGIALGGTVIGCSLLSSGLGHLGGGTMVTFLVSVINFLVWLAKLVGCIWIMRYFMQKLVRDYPEADNHHTYVLGVESAILSALIVAAFTMATVMFVSPESYQEAFETAMAQTSAMLDSNSRAMIEGMMQNLPIIMFVSNLVYCFIYGWILSAILSRNIPSSNPFER